MIVAEAPKSFVTNIRANLIDIAKIAMFLEEQNYELPVKSKSRLAVMGLRLLASQLTQFGIETTEDAIGILRRLGYGESVISGRKDYKPLLKQLSRENIQLDQADYPSPASPIALAVQSKMHEMSTSAGGDKIDYTETEGFPIEPPQLKTRTSIDEQVDLSKLKTGIKDSGGAPIADD